MKKIKYADKSNESEEALIKKYDEIAKKIWTFAKNGLLLNMRFLDTALFRLKFICVSEYHLATDGEKLYYNPKAVTQMFKSEQKSVARNYLHTVLHCIFHHPFAVSKVQPLLWDLSCDIAAENIINEFDIESLNCGRQAEQTDVMKDLLPVGINPLTAEVIYNYLKNNTAHIETEKILKMKASFYVDDHSAWYAEQSRQNDGDGSKKNYNYEETTKKWKDMAKQIQTNLETLSQNRGNQAGKMMQNLRTVTREKYDCSAFLRRFAVFDETMHINQDEFDYIAYCHGLSIYKNMPFIEPLEYKEIKLIKEFVIVIDTSGSVQGDLVQKFIEKAYTILSQEQAFGVRINLYIIQCDAEIQEVKRFTSKEEIQDYIKIMKLKGFGGTDFRPAFEYIDKLKEEKFLTDLKGILYFTDGYGAFPQYKPSYETAFVFVDEYDGAFEPPEVPAWAIKIVLKKDELVEL